MAVTLVTEAEVKLVHRYEKELGISVPRVRLREGRVVQLSRGRGEATSEGE